MFHLTGIIETSKLESMPFPAGICEKKLIKILQKKKILLYREIK